MITDPDDLHAGIKTRLEYEGRLEATASTRAITWAVGTLCFAIAGSATMLLFELRRCRASLQIIEHRVPGRG